MKQWHFFDRVYRRWVVLMIGKYEDFQQEMKDCEYTEAQYLEPAKGMCVELTHENSKQNATVVWLAEWETASLVHEIAHLVMMCFDQCRIPISSENTESFAFYSEYWWTQFNRARKRYPNGNEPKDARK